MNDERRTYPWWEYEQVPCRAPVRRRLVHGLDGQQTDQREGHDSLGHLAGERERRLVLRLQVEDVEPQSPVDARDHDEPHARKADQP